ncbi:MAG: type II toxin-antitoxin system prevent-host-death family antitoxin [Xanthomonadales bacterium]|nr:type II toxin-antitoxin system prevent-host-death family antitoxin [Xanthomonadales bacterium]
MQVNILEAKNRLSELLKSAQAGEEVVIANRGEPVACLVPVRKRSGRQSQASSESIVAWLARHPLPAHAIGSAVDIDAAIAAERDAWE